MDTINESKETYLKTILILQKRMGTVRSIDIANELGISKPSVSNAMKKLRKQGLADVDGNRNILLTEEGMRYANSIFERHIVIENYLIDKVGVDKEIAHEDSCRLEHYVSEETFHKMKESSENKK